MGNPLLVINPAVFVATQVEEPTKIEMGDLLVDRRSAAKDWRKKTGKVIEIDVTNVHHRRYTLKMGDGSTKFDALGWRWQPIEKRKTLINKNIHRQHQILTKWYNELAILDKVEAEAKEHFSKIGV